MHSSLEVRTWSDIIVFGSVQGDAPWHWHRYKIKLRLQQVLQLVQQIQPILEKICMAIATFTTTIAMLSSTASNIPMKPK